VTERIVVVGGSQPRMLAELHACDRCGGEVWLHDLHSMKLAAQPGSVTRCLDCVVREHPGAVWQALADHDDTQRGGSE
jgi:hypothetical protein